MDNQPSICGTAALAAHPLQPGPSSLKAPRIDLAAASLFPRPRIFEPGPEAQHPTQIIPYRDTGFSELCLEDGLARLSLLLGSTQPLSFSELPAGTLNKVLRLYSSEAPDSDCYICKISPRWNNTGLERESWCCEQVRSATSVRVPRVITYLPAANNAFAGHEVLVLECIAGREMVSQDLDHPELVKRLADALHQIHSIPMPGYGWLSPSHSGMHRSWQDFLVQIDNLPVTLSSGTMPEQETLWFQEELAQISLIEPGCLLHGDPKNENVIITPDHEPVLVDYQNCFSGDPLYDVGVGLFFNRELLNHTSLFFKDCHPPKENLKRALCYAMRHCYSTMGHRLMIEDQQSVAWAKLRYYELKDQLLAA